MAELSRFFNSVEGDERTYQANDFAQFFSNFLGNGFFEGLAVSAENTMNTVVAPGSAFIEGHEYTNTSSLTLTHAGADATQDRIDRVVLRLDRDIDVRAIQAFVKQGTAGSDPEPPALTRNDTVYELSLAQVKVEAGKSFIDDSQITDERGNPEVCGRVNIASVVADQITSVDVKRPDAGAWELGQGLSSFYMSGSSHPEIFQEWLDTLNITPETYNRNMNQLRAYVETQSNRNNTGVQTITLFDSAYANDYVIHGVFKRASNSIDLGRWGNWQEERLMFDQGTDDNGSFVQYTNGDMECWFEDPIVTQVRTSATGGTYWDYKTFNFPRPFIERPVVTPLSRRSANTQWAGLRGATNSTCEVYIFSTAEDGAGYLGYHAKGRWR
jgi:hypothetical protein